MRTLKSAYCVLIVGVICLNVSQCVAQPNHNLQGLTAYGNQTKKYMSIMHYTGITVALKAVALSNDHSLMNQEAWRSGTLSQLRILSTASRNIQSIRPVPHGYEKLDRDFAGLGRQMETAASTYRKGIETKNDNLVYNAFGSMKDVDNTLVALSSMRKQ